MRKLYVYTNPDKVTDFIEKMITNYWYDISYKLTETKDDIHTTNMYSLRDAQRFFDEIYIDNIIIWPNEKQNVTNKEIRDGHNLCNIFGSYTAYGSDSKWDGKSWREIIKSLDRQQRKEMIKID